MKTGFAVIWKSNKKEKSECFETMSQANDKVNELKAKGYKGIKIEQCIY